MKYSLTFFICLFISGFSFAQTDELTAAEEEAFQKVIDSIENSFSYQYGEIDLQDGLAKLKVPEGYKFLDETQSAYVLTQLWGNPPSEVLGLLFPEEISPISDNFTYAVEIEYSEEGYIDDDDAGDIDYDELLAEMKKDVSDVNSQRMEQGYGSMDLIGWASAPFYDHANKKLHWAKELKFEDAEVNTLNYNIRVLGRKGYLNMNAIGDIDVLPVFNRDIDKILASVEFTKGNRYSDFNPDMDDVAAYGIGGLIAGKILAKAGFFAVILKFWKIIAVGAIGLFGVFKKKIFGQKDDGNA
ncbi:DUF2167 domain-containing protein [Maribacter luteus]|uniref:DUF2167 domain-containing protein n=1 Tax=Maribacter luteus TaxID=2594478 RepID=UPI0024921B94|nr:DUF2167 domain-containing protein [Maribacter luteus]